MSSISPCPHFILLNANPREMNNEVTEVRPFHSFLKCGWRRWSPIIPIRFGQHSQNNNRRSGIKISGSGRTPSVDVTENRYSVLGGAGGGTCLAFVGSFSLWNTQKDFSCMTTRNVKGTNFKAI